MAVVRSTRPSRWWLVVTVTAGLVSAVAAGAALIHQREASRLIGEGQLLWADGRAGIDQIEEDLASGTSPDRAVRRLRNALGNEAAAIVDPNGVVTASTSPDLEGWVVDEPTLLRAIRQRQFGAVAGPIDRPIRLDGVEEWQRGDVLYVSLSPGEERDLLLFYDIGALTERRVRIEGIAPAAGQLAAVSGFFLLVAVLTSAGRSRAVRRFREMSLERAYMRKEAEALQRHNAELQQARYRAERALELAEENNRIRSEFVLMINHELRTPLTSVVTGAAVLRAGGLPDGEQHAILDSLVHDGRRLQAMIDQLLTLARVENRSLSFTPQPIHLRDACHHATDAHSRVSHRKPGGGHGGEDVEVLTDLQTFTQLVASLVDNAYTHGASSVEIDCSTQTRPGADLVVGTTPEKAAVISVIDDGPGIRPEFLPRAFEKFEKDSRSSGTGLGLYLARLMAEAIGAALHVWTSPSGTTVSIVMPLSHPGARLEAA